MECVQSVGNYEKSKSINHEQKKGQKLHADICNTIQAENFPNLAKEFLVYVQKAHRTLNRWDKNSMSYYS